MGAPTPWDTHRLLSGLQLVLCCTRMMLTAVELLSPPSRLSQHPLLPLTLESLWAGLLFLQGSLPLPVLERTCYFLLLKEEIPSCCNPSLNPSCSCTLSLVHRLPFLQFWMLMQSKQKPQDFWGCAGSGSGRSQTSGLTAIREPQPAFKYKTKYFLRGCGAHAWGTVPLYTQPAPSHAACAWVSRAQ